MRRLMLAAPLALALAGLAHADDKADATAKCMVTGNSQIESMPADQKAKMGPVVESLCTCIVSKIEAMGDDGAKVLHVLAKQTPEQAAEASDPVKDKANTVAVLVADYGLSEADAGALYDKINPKVSEISQSCSAEAMKSLTP